MHSARVKTVLVVDDTEANRYSLGRHLQKAGYQVWEAGNGREALRLAENQPDLIILDIKLPDMLGYEVCRTLKANPSTGAIPILHVSATFQMSSDRVKGLDGGADGFLNEPVEPEELIAHVQLLLRLRETTESLRQSNESLRQARDELALANDNLERTVQSRTAQLQELVADLEQFSYTITHDMRAPLRAMQGFGELLMESCQSGLTAEGEDLIRRIRTAAVRMDRLITDALSYSKTLRHELTLAPIDTGALIRGILESYPQFEPVHAPISIEGEIPPVLGNEAAMTQCFSNLLRNAVKFCRAGTVPEVRVWAERRPPYVRIWVEDKGIGIAPEDQEKIFNLFEQLEPNPDGTGVGLALVQKVVRRMGGRVGVESQPGHGSRFWVELTSCDLPSKP